MVNGKPDSVFTIHGRDGSFILADFRDGLLHGRHRFMGRDAKAAPKPAPVRPGTDSAGIADED